MNRQLKRQQGFAYIAAILVVVALGGLALAVMRLNTTQQATGTMDLQSAHADQAARAGVDWGLYQALVAQSCQSSTTISLAAVASMNTTVTCEAIAFSEGQKDDGSGAAANKILYRIVATACNAAQCPNNTAAVTQGYVERKRSATACAMADLKPCY